jgi:GNAT superfamily N-acetyltransferase
VILVDCSAKKRRFFYHGPDLLSFNKCTGDCTLGQVLLMMFTVRPAQLNDCDALFTLARGFATSFTVEHSAFESAFAALIQSPEAFLTVAAEGERVVGYVLGFDHHTFYANGRVAWVEEIMVAEDVRGRGAGRKLMESLEQWARRRQSKLVALATRRAAPFYLSLGYDESATFFRKLL